MKTRTQEEFKRKWVGIVEVRTGDRVAQFTSVETFKDGKKKLFTGDVASLKFNIADLPKLAQRVIKPGMKESKKFRIRLNDDGDAVEMVTPVSGMFSAKLAYLGPAKKDQDPIPYEKFYHKGEPDENSHLEFFASYTITEGVFKGVELPAYFLHYKFEGIPEEEEDGGFTRFDTVDTPQASQLHRLQDWAEVHGGILDSPIAWPDDGNILPELQERAMDADRDVNVIIEKGYIKSVQAKENYEEVDLTESLAEDLEDEVDKAFPEETIEDVQEKIQDVKTVKINSKVPASKKKKVLAVDELDDL